jgi:pectate lyase
MFNTLARSTKSHICVFTLIAIMCVSRASFAYEGYGSSTPGGSNGPIYYVTSRADKGPGTLRDGVINRSGPRRIFFKVSGDIILLTDLVIRKPYLTIDGSTAPFPGITIRHSTVTEGEVIIGGTHDIIITNIRFRGLWDRGGVHTNNAANLEIDGGAPDYIARNILIDHCTSRNATDASIEIWGEASDVTFSWNFLYYNWHPTLISHYPAPYRTRNRISLHHNVYAKNNERNPQLRADTRNFDCVNNVVYDWGYFGESSGCGSRIKNTYPDPKVSANYINNYFLARVAPSWALVYGINPGRDSEDGGPNSTVPQGTVITSSKMGSLYVNGNILPPENRDHYSTISSPLVVPASAQVTKYTAKELKTKVVPFVGTKYRTATEQSILNELSSKMIGE